jgi:hypothetical protein
MRLRRTQALLAHIFTDARARAEFFADSVATAKRFGLDDEAARQLAGIDRREVEDFARSLLGKRALDARKTLPLTAKTLGNAFDALLFEAIEGPPNKERHRADAAALARLLASRRNIEPSWIGDLARYELAFVAAARPGGALIMRRFSYAVDEIARQLAAGARPNPARCGRVGLWLRAPGGRLFWRLFSVNGLRHRK